MNCPNCNGTVSAVLDSRYRPDLGGILRRRGCVDCKTRFSTIETIIVLPHKGGRKPVNDKKIQKLKRKPRDY